VSKRERRRREVEREALARGETPEQAAALAKETEREEHKKAAAAPL